MGLKFNPFSGTFDWIVSDDPSWTSAAWGSSLNITVDRKYNFYITIPDGTGTSTQTVDASSFTNWTNGEPIIVKYINNDSSDKSIDWATGVKAESSLSDPETVPANTAVYFTLVKENNGDLLVMSKSKEQTF